MSVPEVSLLVALDRIGAGTLAVVVEAAPGELGPLAARLGVPEVRRMRCGFRLRRVEGAVIAAEGALEAEVVQVCVVSLEPFAQTVVERFEVQFVPEGTEAPDDDLEAPDQIAYVGGAIDVGEAACQQLALALDPYPHAPGAVVDDVPEAAVGPFAGLAALRRQ